MNKILATLGFSSILIGSAHSQLVLDQGFDTEPGDFGDVSVHWPWQSFTVGVDGTLEQVELKLFRWGPPPESQRLWIVKPDSFEYIATQPIPGLPVPDNVINAKMVPIELDEPVPLQEGSEWRILLTGGDVRWVAAPDDSYPQGVSSLGGDFDFAFFTYMNAHEVTAHPEVQGVVPEPRTYALIAGITAGALVFANRLRKKKHRDG